MYRKQIQYKLFLAGVLLGIGLLNVKAGYDIRIYGGDFGFGVETPIEGTAVQDLFDDAQYPDDPIFTDYYTAKAGETGPAFILTQTSGRVEYPQEFDQGDNGENYGGAVSGVFYAPRDGSYQFFVRSDDASALYISSDATRGGLPATPDAEEPACCNAFVADGTRNTDPIDMVAGEARLMEFIWKEAGGGDWFQLGWSIDGGPIEVMPAAYFQRDVNAPGLISLSGVNGGPNGDGVNQNGIVRHPENVTIEERNNANFLVEFDKSGAASLQWQKMVDGTWTDLENEVSPRLTIFATIPDNNSEYRVMVDGTPSDAATLFVDPDLDPPAVQFADHRGNPNGVRIFFTELIDEASAENLSNYTLTGPSGNLQIDSAELLEDGMTVQLLGSFDFQLEQTYDLTIRNIQDRAFAPNTIDPNPYTQSIVYAGGEPIVFDFNSDPVEGLELYGNATVVPSGSFDGSGYLSVTEATDSQLGAAKLTQRFSVQQVKFEFMARITAEGGDSTNPADGFSFNVAEDLPDGTYPQSEEGYAGGEDPASYPQGLAVCFDNWVSGGSDNNVGIDIKYQGELKEFVPLPKTGADPSEDPNTGFPTLVRDGWFPVVIDLKADGTLTVDYDGIRIIDRVDIGWEGINNAQIGFGARTGGENETHHFDNVSVNLQGGEVGPITIDQQPITQEDVPEHQEVLLAVTTGGSEAGLTAQWYKDDEAIEGATTLSYRFIASPSTAGSYHVVVANEFSQATSDPAVVTVVPDTDPPVVASATGSAGFTTVTVNFSEPVNVDDAEDPDNYQIDGGVSVDDATLSSDGTTATLTTSMQAQATLYTLTVNNIQDRAETPNTMETDTTATFFSYGVGLGNVLWEYWGGIDGVAVAGLTDDPRYPDSPDEIRSGTAFHSRTVPTFENDSHDNYGARMSAVLIPPETGQYRLFLRSDDASEFWINMNGDSFDPNNLELIMQQTGCCNAMQVADGTLSALVDLEADQRYAIVGLLKEGGGGDYLTVGWRLPGEDLDSPVGDNEGIPGQYLEAIGPVQGEESVVTVAPADGSRLSPDNPTTLTLTLKDGQVNVVDTATVVMTVNGEEVAADVSKEGDITTISFTLDPANTPASGSVDVMVDYGFTGGGSASQSWSFLTYPSYATDADITQPVDMDTVTIWPDDPEGDDSPGAEQAPNVIDNMASTKYLNFIKLDTGFTVTPSVGASVVNALSFTSANDAPERDPTSFTLMGSNNGTDYTEIASGDIPEFADRFTKVTVRFDNEESYTSYRLIFPTVADEAGANSMQIAEVEFLNLPPITEVSIDTIAIEGENVTITYTGQLQQADAVEGPYTDIAGETDGSHTVSVTGESQKYFRARGQ